jgi:hypothetical protein
MSYRVLIASLAIWLVAGSAMADPASGPVPGAPRDLRNSPIGETPAHDPSCFETYSNIAIPTGYFYPAGIGVEVLDDLHLGLIYVNDVCAIDLGYFKAGPGTTDATVTFYAGSAEDDPPGAVLTSLALPGLPSGENSFHIELPSATLALEDVWLGVSFSTDDAGLLLADPPWPGASDDHFYLQPPGDYFTFGGDPRSNFFLGVYATGTVVAVDEDTDRPAQLGFLTGPAPNPSSQGVDLRFAVQDAGRVQVHVVDAAGRLVARVKDEVLSPGTYTVSWDGRTTGGLRAGPGVYLLRLAMPRFSGIRKVVLMN